MFKVSENSGRQRFTSLKVAAGLLLLIGPQAEVALAQNIPAASQKLTLSGAVDLALKQNLDLQIANIETATRQQDHQIARSKLLPRVGFPMVSNAAPPHFAGSQFGDPRHVSAFFRSPGEKRRMRFPFIRDGFDCGDSFSWPSIAPSSKQLIPDRPCWALKEI